MQELSARAIVIMSSKLLERVSSVFQGGIHFSRSQDTFSHIRKKTSDVALLGGKNGILETDCIFD